MSAEQRSTIPFEMNNAQSKGFPFPIPVMPIHQSTRVISKTFTYWTVSAGIGLVVMGSILTHVFQEQAPYSRDPFRPGLQVTAILFIVVGVLLITTSLIKIVILSLNNKEYRPGEGSSCCLFDDASENDVKSTSFIPENTIIYNPYYPPILVPYNISSGQFSGTDLSEPFMRQPNISFLPGSLFMGEDQEKNPNVAQMHDGDIPIPESKDTMLEMRDQKETNTETTDITTDEIDEDQEMNIQRYMTTSARGEAEKTKY